LRTTYLDTQAGQPDWQIAGERDGDKLTELLPKDATTLLVTGSGGRVGRALRAIWAENRVGGLQIQWHERKAGPGVDVVWDIGRNPPASLPKGLIILHLAGVTKGSTQDLAQNALATAAVCAAARAARARHVFVMSSAAVYRPSADLIGEDDAKEPVSAYGQAKLDAEDVAEQGLAGMGLTVLRLANLAGADALLGNCGPGKTISLDPVPGQARGPERSYIGPHVLAGVLSGLFGHVLRETDLPRVLNLAEPGIMAMADLLDALGQVWEFGPPRPAAIARVALDTMRLQALVPMAPASPTALIADLDRMRGWP
jgi:nucleoside-diphosphate-sugar epimerase